MATIQHVLQPWRRRLMPAKFGRAEFHVEQQGRASGRRTVVHEYPKRDLPYAEDMGRHAIRYQMTGYVIGPYYQEEKELLLVELESEDAKVLEDPYLPLNTHLAYNGQPFLFMCERYSVTETRERGGFAMFEMLFVEAGSPGNLEATTQDDTTGETSAAADEAGTAAATELNTASTFDEVAFEETGAASFDESGFDESGAASFDTAGFEPQNQVIEWSSQEINSGLTFPE